MESYEVLAIAIPKKASDKVAQLLSISATYVRRWRREPDTEDTPNGSGQRSILDRICDLIDVVFLVNPSGVALIVEYINAHHRNLIKTHALPIDSASSRAEHCTELLKEATEAINKLALEGCCNGTLQELIELRDQADRAIECVQKTMSVNNN